MSSPQAMSQSVYRSDIDGLRAVAVSAVVLYHLGLPIGGGFTGVDVFFVISGYLITSIIRQDLSLGRFTVRGFYERRIRRIFPALAVVLLATTAAACILLLPHMLELFGHSLLATLAFGSNLLFWSESGYFSATAETKPLLHTWSLAVEEQFYLLFPLLLIFIKGLAARFQRAILWLLFAGSLALSVWGVAHSPSAAFYLLPTRAWELLIGALLAAEAIAVIPTRGLRQILALAGVALIGCGFFVLTDTSPFPGFAALLPCVGAALLIHTGAQADTFVHRLLSLKPVVFIGLISYSLYLWHWPLIVFYKQSLLGDLTHSVQLALLAASLLLAVLSWRYVETPFRSKAPWTQKLSSFGLFALGSTAIAVVGLALTLSRGWPQRLPDEVARDEVARIEKTMRYNKHETNRIDSCFIGSVHQQQPLDRSKCLTPEAGKRNALIVGDSHAAHLRSGLAAAYPETHFMQATVAGCKPLLQVQGKLHCYRIEHQILNEFIPALHPDVVLLAARWRSSDLQPLIETVKELRKHAGEVIVMGRIVEYKNPLPQLLAVDLWRQREGLVDSQRTREPVMVDREYAKALAAAGIRYVSLQGALCTSQSCITKSGSGLPIQYDYGHLTGEGSALLALKLRDGGFAP